MFREDEIREHLLSYYMDTVVSNNSGVRLASDLNRVSTLAICLRLKEACKGSAMCHLISNILASKRCWTKWLSSQWMNTI